MDDIGRAFHQNIEADGERLEHVLTGVLKGKRFRDEDIRFLLGLTHPPHVERLTDAARKLRQAYFGNKVFLYGFIYFSTFCRNDCSFCHDRRSNTNIFRYRKTQREIISAARRLAEEGVHLIDLTMGEDPHIFGSRDGGFDKLAEMVHEIKTITRLPVMVSPGVVTSDVLEKFAQAGADWYACYQETHNPSLFATLRPGQSYSDRWKAKMDAKAAGLLVEEGILCGVGETMDDVAWSISMMKWLRATQVRVMSFVPQRGTPMAMHPPPDPVREMIIVSVLRLALPYRLIPASLDVAGLSGLLPRLHAGANVITSFIVPESGFLGVASGCLDVENAGRMPFSIGTILRRCGLISGSAMDYSSWLKSHKSVPPEKKTGCLSQ